MTKKLKVTIDSNHTVSYTGGYFQQALLRATTVYTSETGKETASTPINVARYNPELDTGKNNSVFFYIYF